MPAALSVAGAAIPSQLAPSFISSNIPPDPR